MAPRLDPDTERLNTVNQVRFSRLQHRFLYETAIATDESIGGVVRKLVNAAMNDKRHARDQHGNHASWRELHELQAEENR